MIDSTDLLAASATAVETVAGISGSITDGADAMQVIASTGPAGVTAALHESADAFAAFMASVLGMSGTVNDVADVLRAKASYQPTAPDTPLIDPSRRLFVAAEERRLFVAAEERRQVVGAESRHTF